MGVVFAFMLGAGCSARGPRGSRPLLLLCMPRYVGESMNNTKDLPFAVADARRPLLHRHGHARVPVPVVGARAQARRRPSRWRSTCGRWASCCSDTPRWRWPSPSSRRATRSRHAGARRPGASRWSPLARARRRNGVLAVGAGAAARPAVRGVLHGVGVQLGQPVAVRRSGPRGSRPALVLPADVARHDACRPSCCSALRSRSRDCWRCQATRASQLAAVWAFVLIPATSCDRPPSDAVRRHPPHVLHRAADGGARGGRMGLLLCRRRRGERRPRCVSAALAVGIAEPVLFQIRNHPNQNVYFSPGHRRPSGRLRPLRHGLLGQLRPAGGGWSAAEAERAQMPVVVTANAWEVAVVDAARFPRNLRSASGSRAATIWTSACSRVPDRTCSTPSAHPDIVHRVTTSDGTPLCVVLRGPSTRSWRHGCQQTGARPMTDADCKREPSPISASSGRAIRTAKDFSDRLELFNDIFNPLVSDRRRQGTPRGGDRRGHRPVRQRSWRRPAPRTSSPSSRRTRFASSRRTPGGARSDHLPERDRRSPAADRRSRLRVFDRRAAPHSGPGSGGRAAYRALRPGGTFAVWLYGREGNALPGPRGLALVAHAPAAAPRARSVRRRSTLRSGST